MTAILEDALELKVDKWGTLNTAASPNKLPDGNSPNNQNVWMDEKPGSVVTAKGYTKLGQLPSGLPPTLLINFFKSSDGSSQLICSDGQNVYWTTNYTTFTTITTGLSAFFQLRGAVIRDKLWLTNGSDSVMTWDGSTLVSLNGSGGTPTVPKGKFIAYHDERVWMFGVNGELSSARFSALADSSGTEIAPTHASAWPTDNEIQISEGDADIGTGLFLYRGYLYCSKQYSIWRIVGYDEYTYARVKTRSSTGTRFQESIQIKDNLVHFIGVDGMYVFDGEEAKRISDIIDPAASEEGVFAFRNLQQPLLNNQFWNVTDTAAFAAGTDPANLSTADDTLSLIPADDTQSDFTSGTNSNTTPSDNPGYVQLGLVTSGGTTETVQEGKTPSINGVVGIIGLASYMNDGLESLSCGVINATDSGEFDWSIMFGSTIPVGSVTIENFYFERADSALFYEYAKIQYTTDGTTWVDATSVTLPSSSFSSTPLTYWTPSSGGGYRTTPTDLSVDFTTVSCIGLRFKIKANKGAFVLREFYIFKAGYKSVGTFTSKSIDYGSVPATYGTLAASIVDNDEAYQFFTQSSADGSTWDALVNVSNGAAIGSALKRYLRWGVTLHSSTGISTPVVDKVYVGATYLSEVHDTGGNIFQWGAFSASYNKAGETITFYYRAAATSIGVASESWTAIVPGAIPGAAVARRYIQIKAELSTTDSANAPSIDSFTVNWILDSGLGINTLQNVASVVILNRYWLAAATLGADENDIVVVLGKNTFGSPWHKKDFPFLSFCRFQDYYIAGSSTDGSIYRLESGYSKDGSAMDSFYETADFSKDEFQLKGRELLVTADRTGPYNLSVGWSIDGGLSYTEKSMDLTRDDDASLSFTQKFNVSFMSNSVRFRVRINAADQPFSVDEMKCYYRLSPQRGSLNVG
jgi:hypothetical protein